MEVWKDFWNMMAPIFITFVGTVKMVQGETDDSLPAMGIGILMIALGLVINIINYGNHNGKQNDK